MKIRKRMVLIPEELIAKMDKLKALKNKGKILSTAELLQTLVDEALIKETKKLKKMML
ncbi:MAG: hypothetical protein U0T83_06835 [Bacteriovoracaceae bacterium]